MKTLKEKIEVMQAALDGEKIEVITFDGLNSWVEISVNAEKIQWCWADMDYRIKPEPMEFWVNVYSNDISAAYRTEKEAVSATNSGYTKTIKVREVID